jgi:putative ABC transport system permease protein
VTFQSAAPTGAQWSGRIEIDGMTLASDLASAPRPRAVDAGYFDVYGAPLLQGRRLSPGDADDSVHVVIVNRSFVHRLLGDQPALGRRLRYPSSTGSDAATSPPWFEIVGVVENLQHNALDSDLVAPQIFHPFDPARLSGVSMIVRTQEAVPSTLGAAVHVAVAATDPELRLGTLQTGEAINAEAMAVMQVVGTMLLFIVGTGLLLSSAGVYAVMSFTVAQRRREIGIRRALGATQRQVLTKVFAKAVSQIGGGVIVGACLAALLIHATGGDAAIPTIVLVPIVALLIAAISLGAALVPARRGLAIEPVEALRSE